MVYMRRRNLKVCILKLLIQIQSLVSLQFWIKTPQPKLQWAKLLGSVSQRVLFLQHGSRHLKPRSLKRSRLFFSVRLYQQYQEVIQILKSDNLQYNTGSSCLMWISLLRIVLLRFFKTITKNLPNAIFMHYQFC